MGDCITYCDCYIDSYELDWGCGHILQRQFDGLGGDDDGGGAFRGWVDDSFHDGLPEDGDIDVLHVTIGIRCSSCV